MTKEYAFTYECDHCGDIIKNRCLHLDDDGELEIGTWQLSQMIFECDNCGAGYGNGDFEMIEFNGPADWYDPEEDDEEDEEDVG